MLLCVFIVRFDELSLLFAAQMFPIGQECVIVSIFE